MVEIRENLGTIVERAKQIVKVSKDEWANYEKAETAIERRFKVRFEWDEGTLMYFKKKDYPNDFPLGEEEGCYKFDVDEWLDEKPTSPKLIKAKEALAAAYWKVMNNIKKRCKLQDVEAEEMDVQFCLRYGLTLKSWQFPQKWQDLQIWAYDVEAIAAARKNRKED